MRLTHPGRPESTYCRRCEEFAGEGLIDRIHQALVERSFEGRIVGVVARDATEIEAREKPAPKDDDPTPPPASPRKPGRPRKDQPAPPRSLSRLERQPGQTLAQMLAGLPAQCDVGTKTNSRVATANAANGTASGPSSETPVGRESV